MYLADSSVSGRFYVLVILCIWQVLAAYARQHYRSHARSALLLLSLLRWHRVCGAGVQWDQVQQDHQKGAQASRGCAGAKAKRRVACVLLRVLACRGCDCLRCVLAMRARVPQCGCAKCEVVMEKPREQMLRDAVADSARARAAFRGCE